MYLCVSMCVRVLFVCEFCVCPVCVHMCKSARACVFVCVFLCVLLCVFLYMHCVFVCLCVHACMRMFYKDNKGAGIGVILLF